MFASKGEEAYIPKDLNDAVAHLKMIVSADELETIQKASMDEMTQYHFGLGMWIRNEWRLWSPYFPSRYKSWFGEKGIWHPDDITAITLDALWCDLNKVEYDLTKAIKKYKDYWKKEEEKEKTTYLY
jgi:hypothetical protein